MNGSYRHDPQALARLVDGRWDRAPNSRWEFNRLISGVDVQAARRRVAGTLLYSGKSVNIDNLVGRLGHDPTWLAVIASDQEQIQQSRVPVLRVENVPEAINSLAVACRDNYSGKVVAVTGSVGKTTIRRMLDKTLSPHHTVATSSRSDNGFKIIRQQLVRLSDEDYATFEIARIALPGGEQLIRPDVAVIGTLAEAHLEDLGSLQNIARLKGQLIQGLSPGGTAVINMDSPWVSEVFHLAEEQQCKVITYGEHPAADIRLVDFQHSSSQCRVSVFDANYTYSLRVAGRHNAVNSLAVLGVLSALDLEPGEYLEALADFQPVKRRGRVEDLAVSGATFTVVDESFNANPTSMHAALQSYGASYTDRRKVVILGDMLELGAASEQLHREIAPQLREIRPDHTILVGPQMKALYEALPDDGKKHHEQTPAKALTHLTNLLQHNDAVFIKASNGTGLGKLVRDLREIAD